MRDYDILLVSQPGLSWAERGALLGPQLPLSSHPHSQSFPPSPSCSVQSNPPHSAPGTLLLPPPPLHPSSPRAPDTEPTNALPTGFITSPGQHSALQPHQQLTHAPSPTWNPTPCPQKCKKTKKVTCVCQGWKESQRSNQTPPTLSRQGN